MKRALAMLVLFVGFVGIAYALGSFLGAEAPRRAPAIACRENRPKRIASTPEVVGCYRSGASFLTLSEDGSFSGWSEYLGPKEDDNWCGFGSRREEEGEQTGRWSIDGEHLRLNFHRSGIAVEWTVVEHEARPALCGRIRRTDESWLWVRE
jgi:hypothetical protein